MSNKELLQSNNELLQAIRDVLGNGTTYEEIINQVGKESEFDSGCYYRVVDSELEWINPPMTQDTLYRTTKRLFNQPVYCFNSQMLLISNSTSTKTCPGLSNVLVDYIRVWGSDGELDKSLLTYSSNSNGLTLQIEPTAMSSQVVGIYIECRIVYEGEPA